MEGIVNWECKACILIMENVSSKIKVKLYITSLNSHSAGICSGTRC
jgi:hypothetical protein